MKTSHVRQLIAAFGLGSFALMGMAPVTLTHHGTKARILENQRQSLEHQLNVLIPAEKRDNNPLDDVITVNSPEFLKTPTTGVYRARSGDQPVAAIFSPVVAQGYAGPIKLIVAVRQDGRLADVRVLHPKETPGLGDKVASERSDWILGFTGLALDDPPAEAWGLKATGGVFDQFTGATITPRGVVNAVYAPLKYFDTNRDLLFHAKSEVPMS